MSIELKQAAQRALNALDEATTYTGSPSWSPSMTDECIAAASALRASLAQQPATGEPVNGPHCTTCGASMDEPHHPACGALTAVIIGVNTMAAQDDRQRRRFLAKKIHQTLRGAITHPAPSVPDGLQWFTVAEHGLPEVGEVVVGGLWYTDPWLKPECATSFMWGQCRVVGTKHRDFKDGKQWLTFGPSHNQITHWARLNPPAMLAANEGGK